MYTQSMMKVREIVGSVRREFAKWIWPAMKYRSHSTQLGIECEGTFNPVQWTSSILPQIFGLTRSYSSFRPDHAVLTAIITATFSKQVRLVPSETPPKTSRRPRKLVKKDQKKVASANTVVEMTEVASSSVAVCSDLVLVQGFFGSQNCFPNAPNQQTGINGAMLAYSSISNRVDWPVVNAGNDLNIAFAVERSILHRITPPKDFCQADLESVHVKARLSLSGPVLC